MTLAGPDLVIDRSADAVSKGDSSVGFPPVPLNKVRCVPTSGMSKIALPAPTTKEDPTLGLALNVTVAPLSEVVMFRLRACYRL